MRILRKNVFLVCLLACFTTGVKPCLAESGSGIGGGTIDSRISWCDEIALVIEDSTEEAQQLIGRNNDYRGALEEFYLGFIDALRVPPQATLSASSSLTYRAVSRGVELAQIFGIPEIVERTYDADNYQQYVELTSLVRFMNWYSKSIVRVAARIDREHFIPYGYSYSCPGCNAYPNMIELQSLFVDTSIDLLEDFNLSFISLKTSRDTFIPAIRVDLYLTALAFLSEEVGKDLEESIFNNAYSCHSRRLERLARKVNRYLLERTDTSLDSVTLNQYTLKINQIVGNIKDETCY